MHVVKVGGNELDVPGFAEALAINVKNLGEPTVVVHGGGRAVSSLQRRLGITPAKIDGLRVTDAASLEVATMVLCGLANKRLVAAFQCAGLDALGLSGVDGGLVRATKKSHEHDLGFVGQVAHIRTELLSHLLSLGHTVILSPISLGADGLLYNVNADEVAAATAIAANADALSFVTNVPGVMDNDAVIGRISTQQIGALERSGVVEGGMVPKLRAARDASLAGVARVRIVDLMGLSSGTGTVVVASQNRTSTHPMDATA
jgi:acetylglutamate kinase